MAYVDRLLDDAVVQQQIALIAQGITDVIVQKAANPAPAPPGAPLRPDLEQIEVSDDLNNLDVTPPDLNPDDYSSTLLDAFTDGLYNTLINGGTGLSEEVQAAAEALYTARRDRDTEKLLDRAGDQYEAMGWELPPGALIAAQQEALNENARNQSDASNNILIESFKLGQANMIHAEDTVVAVESAIMDYRTKYFQALVAEYQAKVAYLAAEIQKELGLAEIASKQN